MTIRDLTKALREAAGVASSKKVVLRFGECEHSGDANEYERDITKSGGKVLKTQVDEEGEECVISVEVTDLDAFKTAFKKTDSWGFSSLAR